MDATRWYYLDGQQSVGPFLWERLMELSKAAIIGPNTFVWREGTKDWVSLAGAIQARQSTPTPPPPPLPIVPKPSERIGSVAADPPPKHSPEVRVPSASPVAATGERAVAAKKQWSPTPVAPWRRYAARILDTTIHGVSGVMLLAYAWYSIAPISADAFFTSLSTPIGGLIDFVITTLIAVLVGAVVVGSTGSSIGKAIFGVKVVDSNHKPIGVINGLAREFRVWWAGMALGIPIIAIVTMSRAYSKLKKEGTTSWDSPYGYVVLYRPNGPLQYFLNAIGIVVLVVTVSIVRAMNRM